MRRARFALLLYPRAWRERYGREFEALLEQTGVGWRDFANVILGAMQMQLRSIGFGKIAAAGALLGLLAGVVALRELPKTYISKSTVRLTGPAAASDNELISTVADLNNVALSRVSLEEIIRKEGLYHDEQATTPIEDIIKRMRQGIEIRVLKPRDQGLAAIVVQFVYPDREHAYKVTSELVGAFSSAVAHGRQGGSLEILDPPSIPEGPIKPARGVVLLMGLFGGLALAGVAGLLKRHATRAAA